MIATWMMYHIAVVSLLGLAAASLEDVVQRYRLGSRWIWMGAVAGSLVVPAMLVVVRAVWPNVSAIPGVQLGRITVVEAEPLADPGPGGTAAPTGGLGLADLDPILLGGWIVMSILLLAYFGRSAVALRLSRHGWTQATLLGERVWVAEKAGPAVVGVRRPSIVVPRWALTLPEQELRLMLAHEREHIRAGDTRLLVAGYAVAVALPWNLPLWFIARRLRDAIEIDCDRRVLRQSGDPRSYGMLLLAVGGRPPALPAGVAALSRGKTQLERRIRAMTRAVGRHRAGAALVGTLLSVGLLMVACSVEPPAQADTVVGEPDTPPEPVTTSPDEPPIRVIEAPAREPDPEPEPERLAEASRENIPDPVYLEISRTPPQTRPNANARSDDQPSFTPMEVRPVLRNGNVLAQALQRNYPAMLKDSGIEGTTTLWVRIDEEGRVVDTRVYASSGYPQFDEVAIQTMQNEAQFSPARNRDQPVAVWIQIPVVFQVAR